MDNKNKEIAKQRNLQTELKNQISNIKAKVPTYITVFTLITTCLIYYLQDKVYKQFGNSINFIKFGIVVFLIIVIIYIYKNYKSVQKKEKKLKVINNKLYSLMKLESEDKND